jgi:hypothetical protein
MVDRKWLYPPHPVVAQIEAERADGSLPPSLMLIHADVLTHAKTFAEAALTVVGATSMLIETERQARAFANLVERCSRAPRCLDCGALPKCERCATYSKQQESETMTLIVNSNEPLVIALNVTGSMVKRDAPARAEGDGKSLTRLEYAIERIDELLQRLPSETEVTMLVFGSNVRPLCFAVPGPNARAALAGIDAADAGSSAGAMLEWLLHTTLVKGQRRASLLLITDHEPADRIRWEAYAHYNATLQQNQLAIHVLTVGDTDLDPEAFNALGRSERHSVSPLFGSEIMLGKPASSPPGVDAARANTEPPSVAPPQHRDNEYVAPAKHAPAAAAKRAPTSHAPHSGKKGKEST